MPHPRLHLVLLAPPGTSISQTRTEIEAELVGKALLDRPVDWPNSTVVDGDGELKIDLRFLSATDRNTVYSRITRNAVLNALRSRGFRGIIARHECSHDDPVVVDCKTDPASAYQETIV